MNGNYNQDHRPNHFYCWDSWQNDQQTWWFDNGNICVHPEWHA